MCVSLCVVMCRIIIYTYYTYRCRIYKIHTIYQSHTINQSHTIHQSIPYPSLEKSLALRKKVFHSGGREALSTAKLLCVVCVCVCVRV